MKDLEKSRISEISQLHSEIAGYIKVTLEKAIRIGELLAEQKAGMDHGTWLPWMEDGRSSPRLSYFMISLLDELGQVVNNESETVFLKMDFSVIPPFPQGMGLRSAQSITGGAPQGQGPLPNFGQSAFHMESLFISSKTKA